MKFKIHKLMLKALPMLLLSFMTWAGDTKAQVTCSGGTTNIPRSGSVTVNGIVISTSYTGDVLNYSSGSWSSCNGAVTTSNNSLDVGTGNFSSPTTPSPWSITLNFDKPVNDLIVVLTATGSGGSPSSNENFIFNTNGGSVSITAGINCYSTINNNTIYSGGGAPIDNSGTSGGGGGLFKITSPKAYTQLTINGNGGLNGTLMALCGPSIKPACNAGAVSPAVTSALSYTCPATSINLNTAHTGTVPSGSSLVWYKNNSHTGTPLTASEASNATTGTYYAFYLDSANSCFSPASSAVTVTYSCPNSFGCNSNMYLSQDNTLFIVGTNTNPFTYPVVGIASVNYNAIALNSLDGRLYGMQDNSRNLLRINTDGSSTNLGAVTGLPAAGVVFAGEIDNAGNYYVKINTDNNELYRIDLTTRVATRILLTASNTIPDLGYSITTGLLYGVNSGGGQLVSINPITGAVTGIGITPGGIISFGAMYTSGTGEVFGVNNGGGFYQFNLTTGNRIKISDALASNTNDGAHCVTVPITFTADLAVTKTDGVAQYFPGASTTYTIVVKNNGPFGVLNAKVTDLVPAGIPAANVSYTAVASAGSTTSVSGTQTGAINDLVGLPVGGTITYTVVVNIPSDFTESLVNTVMVTPPSNISDSNMANNTAVDTDTSTSCSTDILNWVQTRKDDPNRDGFGIFPGSDPYIQSLDDAGGTTILTGNFSPAYNSYTVNTNKLEFDLSFTDYNDGLTSELWVNGTRYMNFVVPRDNDPLPYYIADYNNRTVTAPVTAFNGATVNGANSISIAESKLDAPANSTVIVKTHITLTFPSNITLSSGSIQIRNIYPYFAETSNWRSQGDYEYWISLPACTPVATDLYVTKTDGKNNYTPGTTSTYTIVAGNNGPVGVSGAQVSDPVPAGILAANVSYTAIASAGATTTVSGTRTGAISDLVNLPVGGTVTYTVTISVPSNFTGNLINTVTVTPPSNATDSNPANNSATDTNTYSAANCYKPGITSGTALVTNHGISALGRAGADDKDNWPMVRQSAWTALEAKTKGFVINRIPTTMQVDAIPNPIEGMMVYDEEADCLKIYTTTDGSTFSWRCFTAQTCPTN